MSSTSQERYHILDTLPEAFLTRVARMAADRLKTPRALISFLGENGQWKTWTVGTNGQEIPSVDSFCVEVMTSSGVTVIEDTTQRESFMDHPAVAKPPGIRFFAGVSLKTPQDVPIGCLSVLDVQPHDLSRAQEKQLESLAEVVVNKLEHRTSTAPEFTAGRMEPRSPGPSEPVSFDQLGTLLRTSVHPVLLLDIGTLTILDANPAARNDLSGEGEELENRSFADLFQISEEDLKRQLQSIREGTATQILLNVAEDTESGPRPSHYLALETSTDSESILVMIALTFSERLRVAARLRQQENIETIRTLVGGIAHNFNNILHSAIVYLQMALEDLREGESPITFLERTEDDLHEAAALVSKLQTFSRAEGKAISIRVDVAEVAEEAIPLVESITPPGTHIHSHLEPGCTIKGDPTQLHEMVVNLLTNAAEATSADDEVRLEVERMEVGPAFARNFPHLTPGPYVHLSVQDTGTGMDPEMRAHIFEPFYTTKEGPRVAGLGLSVVDGIVRAHEGQIDIQTEQEKGTTIHVYLPADDDSAADEPSSQ